MRLRLPFSGYSRGYKIVEVDANTLEEAKELLEDYSYTVLKTVIVRDDREHSPEDATVI